MPEKAYFHSYPKTAIWVDKFKETDNFADAGMEDTQGRCTFAVQIAEFGLDELSRFGKQGPTEANLDQQNETTSEVEFVSTMDYKILSWACCHLARCFKGKREYKAEVVQRRQSVKVTDIVTASDLSFMVLALQSYWELYKAYAARVFKLKDNDGVFGKREKAAIAKKQKDGKVHSICGGNMLSGPEGTKRYHEMVCYISVVLKQHKGLPEKLDHDFTAFCLSQQEASCEPEAVPPPAVEKGTTLIGAELAYFEMMKNQWEMA